MSEIFEIFSNYAWLLLAGCFAACICIAYEYLMRRGAK